MIVTAIIIAVGFVAIQLLYFLQTKRAIETYRSFFQKNKESNYGTYQRGKTIQLINVAPANSEFYQLIQEVNKYIEKTKGTTDFSILQNKVERKLSMLSDQASAKLSFPTHIGLMGTFAGVFIGLMAFNCNFEDLTGITDAAIRNLLYGVLISMATSFVGLLLTTWNNHLISAAQKHIDNNKNEFYDFIQTELMPSLDESITKAIGHLHQTISNFAPTFDEVIKNFKSTFETCTNSFGASFKEDVETVTSAVNAMGANMDKINQNVALQQEILNTIKGEELIWGMQEFINAASSFKKVTQALRILETLHNKIVEVTNKTIECQQQYNESLSTPKELIESINQLLARVKNYEDSVNLVAEKLKQEDIITTAQFKAMEDILNNIRKKQQIVDNVSDAADRQVEEYLKQQVHDIEERSAEHLSVVYKMFDELEENQKAFATALKEKFDLKDIDKEFAHLAKLDKIEDIYKLLEELKESTVKQEKLREMFNTISNKLSTSRSPIPTQPTPTDPKPIPTTPHKHRFTRWLKRLIP